MGDRPPYVSVVLACYNEAEHIEQSFREIRETLVQTTWPFEVLFVDDESRDGTREILKGIVEAHHHLDLKLIFHETNRGRGATVTDGFRAARGEIAGYLDVDLEVHCRYIPSLVRAIERGADIATVRRIYALQLASLDRYFMSRGYSFLVRKLLQVPCPRHGDRLQVLPPGDGAAPSGRDRGRGLVLGHRVHGPRGPKGAHGRGGPRAPTSDGTTRPRRCAACATRCATSDSSWPSGGV